MRAIKLLLLAVVFSIQPLTAQDSNQEQRSNHYLDHVLLGINDLEKGMDDFEKLTGVKPRKDGRNASLGTHSAIVGLGENMFMEIIAPDPELDPDSLDPALRQLVFDRLATMGELTPFRWAIGTSNLERTTRFIRRASNRSSEIMAGARKRGWGRAQEWHWVSVTLPESRVTPFFVQWKDESKRPQDRAPQGCTLDALHVTSRNYKSVLNLAATMQVDIELQGSDVDSLSYELDCPAGEVVFEPVNLTIFHDTPALRSKN